MNKVKFQFEMPETNANRLEELSKQAGVAKKDIINNALTILEWAIEEVQTGRKVCSFKEGDGSYRELVLPLLKQFGAMSSVSGGAEREPSPDAEHLNSR